LVELHVFYVPEEVWNFTLNTVPVALSSKFVSAGFIRVSPHITLRVLREKLGEYLGGVAVADKFRFLKCIGKKLAVVNAKQETELELKSFAPPYALFPELYLLPAVEHFKDVYPLLSSTQQRHHFNENDNSEKGKFNQCNQNGSSASLFTPNHSNPEDSKTSQQSHLSQDQEEGNTPKWNDKAKGTAFTLHVNHKLTNMKNNDHQKETKLRKNRTQGAGILKVMEDQTTDYLHKPQRLV
ncbi:Spermatogenesis-associated protein 1, partial [Merops nubicus]